MRPHRRDCARHSQALTIKLKKDLPIEEIERIIAEDNPWVRFVAERA